VASKLGYSEKTIRRWIEAGRLRAHRIGHQWRIAEADLQDFLNRCRT
jgi:excisionase family DNA binding protein